MVEVGVTMLAVWLVGGCSVRGTSVDVGNVVGGLDEEPCTLLVTMVVSSSESTITLFAGVETVQRPWEVRWAFMMAWPWWSTLA
jgi:hypothetical protein